MIASDCCCPLIYGSYGSGLVQASHDYSPLYQGQQRYGTQQPRDFVPISVPHRGLLSNVPIPPMSHCCREVRIPESTTWVMLDRPKHPTTSGIPYLTHSECDNKIPYNNIFIGHRWLWKMILWKWYHISMLYIHLHTPIHTNTHTHISLMF